MMLVSWNAKINNKFCYVQRFSDDPQECNVF